jgi:DNA-binding CsgD family transcriptional regulator
MNNSTSFSNGVVYSVSYNEQSIVDDTKLNYVQNNIFFTENDSDIKKSLTEVFFPLSIVQNNSSLEAIVLYLKENLNLNYSKIASLLNRNQRTIWATYANAKKKNIIINLDNISNITLPSTIFVSRNFSVLETIVFYLRMNQALSFNQISLILGKNYRTIWTIYKRSLKKLTNKQINDY